MWPSNPRSAALCVTIPIVAIADRIAFCLCQQGPKSKQPDLVDDNAGFNGHGRKFRDCSTCFPHIGLGTALQQRLHQYRCYHTHPNDLPERRSVSTTVRANSIAPSTSPCRPISRARWISINDRLFGIVERFR